MLLSRKDRKIRTGSIVYDHAWDAIMYLEQRTEFWRQEQPSAKKTKKEKLRYVATEKMRINNWVSRERDKIDNGNCNMPTMWSVSTFHLNVPFLVYFSNRC